MAATAATTGRRDRVDAATTGSRSRSRAPSRARGDVATGESYTSNIMDTSAFTQHPLFPSLPASVPLAYTLMTAACLSERPGDRPTFSQLLVLLQDMAVDVASGAYMNSVGAMQVRCGASVVELCAPGNSIATCELRSHVALLPQA